MLSPWQGQNGNPGFILFFGVRAVYRTRASRSQGKVRFQEGKFYTAFRLVVGLPFIGLLVTYMVHPKALAWATVLLPQWAQATGVALGMASTLPVWWVHHALGDNFSVRLHVRDEHTLATTGTYRWVRHPMYTVLYLFSAATFLITENWLMGSFFFVPLTIIVVTRVKKEDQVMTEKFGDAYRLYCQSTGRFVPRIEPQLWRNLQPSKTEPRAQASPQGTSSTPKANLQQPTRLSHPVEGER